MSAYINIKKKKNSQHCCNYSAGKVQKHWMHGIEALWMHWGFYHEDKKWTCT